MKTRTRRSMRGWRAALPAAALWAGLAGRAWAAEARAAEGGAEPAAAPGPASEAPAAQPEQPVDAQAEQLNYDRRQGIVEGVGHVVIRRGRDELRADYVRYDVKTGDASARGNVTLRRGADVWRGRQLEYNFETGLGRAENLTFEAPPFRLVDSRDAQKGPDNRYVFRDTTFTTCTNPHPHCHFHVRARSVEVVPGESIKARGPTWYFGRVPVMHLPYWSRNLRERDGWRLVPGYGSRVGAFLLTSYRYPLGPSARGETHLDYRTRRGFAAGQDFGWDAAGDGTGPGDFRAYYADDQEPLDKDEDPATSDIDNARYRLRLRQALQPTERDQIHLRAHYLSDTDVLEDFFEREFRAEREPDNHLTYLHREENYTVSAVARKRLNDFYTNVERLPEVALDLLRREVGASSVYYEGRTAAGFLRKTWEAQSDAPDYSTFRLDTENMLYRPSRHFGFLNVIPRAGYRGTYYAETRRTVAETEVRLVYTTNTVRDAEGRTSSTVTSGTQTNAIRRDLERGADLRSRVELGAESSFKAFKSWQGAEGVYRHIVEPYVNYTLVPEPNLLPEDLYAFDEVDELGEEHHLRLGVRNKVQTRRPDGPFDLMDVNVYTVYRIHRPDEGKALRDVVFDAELRPAERLTVELDGVLNVPDSEVERVSARIREDVDTLLTWSLEYNYRREDSSLLAYEATLLPRGRWTFSLYTRYEFEARHLEEIGGFVQRNLDCLAIRAGVNVMPGYTRADGGEQEDDLRFVFGIWLTAFPEVGLSDRYLN